MEFIYKNKPISKIVGEFYSTAGTFNGFVHVPSKSIIERIFGPDAWYKSEFDKDGIHSIIWECRNSLALDNFLDSIRIEFNSNLVYSAEVNRYNPYWHTNQRICKNPEWIERIIRLTKESS